MKNFREKVLKTVKKIKPGEIKTYKEVAEISGNKKAWRAVANILAKNKDPEIPCHRVIKSDFTVGGYQGSFKNSWKKLEILLKEGVSIDKKKMGIKNLKR
jgi:O-6-methylguanine DNA methyltransferase